MDSISFAKHSQVPMSLDRAATFWARITGHKKVHRATLNRWATKGVKGHRLQAERFGGRWFVRPSALREFMTAINGPSPLTDQQRDAEITAAQHRLDQIVGPQHK